MHHDVALVNGHCMLKYLHTYAYMYIHDIVLGEFLSKGKAQAWEADL